MRRNASTRLIVATPAALLQAFDERTTDIAARLRETAAELRAGTINRHHAANRLAQLADQIRKETR